MSGLDELYSCLKMKQAFTRTGAFMNESRTKQKKLRKTAVLKACDCDCIMDLHVVIRDASGHSVAPLCVWFTKIHSAEQHRNICSLAVQEIIFLHERGGGVGRKNDEERGSGQD